jgi:ketosteroid isomerase-like protein
MKCTFPRKEVRIKRGTVQTGRGIGLGTRRNDSDVPAPLEVVKELYAKLTAGDPDSALALMSDDIEWITMMDYKVAGRGPQKVLEGMLIPAMKEWEPYTLTPHEFICDGDKVVSVGRFKGTNRATGKHVEVDYSHIWEVRGHKIVRHRQFIDTGKIEPARHPG